VEAYGLHVTILGGLSYAAWQVDCLPAIEEVLHRELVICDDAAIDLLAQSAEFLDDLSARAT
jgi:hypothetical protein